MLSATLSFGVHHVSHLSRVDVLHRAAKRIVGDKVGGTDEAITARVDHIPEDVALKRGDHIDDAYPGFVRHMLQRSDNRGVDELLLCDPPLLQADLAFDDRFEELKMLDDPAEGDEVAVIDAVVAVRRQAAASCSSA